MDDTRIPKKLKNFNTCDDNVGLASWSNLNHDLLFSVMMRVGVFDFIALSGVCKSWRSVAVCNWNKFMVTKQPMRLSISRRLNKKDCYLEEDTRRKLMTSIPHSDGRTCVGITCGYLIFYGEKTCDFWLVNPFTRKQLHFPGFPFSVNSFPTYIRGILVFSPSMSGWVFVVLCKLTTKISFCLAGKDARWRNVSSNSTINDLHFFKGKIYVIDMQFRLWELKFNPSPTLILHKIGNFLQQNFGDVEFVSTCLNLYVRDTLYDVFTEVDFDEMRYVNSEIQGYAIFVSDFFKWDAVIKPDTWTYPWTQYGRINRSYSEKTNMCSTKTMWYLPHECLIDNDSDMLLNKLED